MKKFMVIVRVEKEDFLAKIEAESAYAAEHYYLDQGVCGMHEYGVEGAMAFDAQSMDTDTFRGMVMDSNPIGNVELSDLIKARNKKILAKDEAERTIAANERKIKELQAQIEAAKRILAA